MINFRMISPLKWQLHTQIVAGLVLGALAGIALGPVAVNIRPVGTLFIRLITMIVVPLVLSSLVVGTASLNDIGKLGRIGLKVLLFFIITTAIAIIIGILLTDISGPGRNLDPEAQKQLLANYNKITSENLQRLSSNKPGIISILINIVPVNPLKALADGEMLQIIFFSLLLGISIIFISGNKKTILNGFFEGINDAMIQIVHIVMKIAPFGVFALIAALTGEFGFRILLTLIQYALVVFFGLALHVLIVFSLSLKLFTSMSMGTFFRGLRDAQIVAFSTSSSNATLPVNMDCTEKNLRVPRDIVNFVLPLGATINMNGTALYQGVSAVFIAQVYGIDLSLTDQFLIVLTATLAAIGAAGVPGAGFVTLALVLQTIGIPLEGIALIIGVERILDMCRTVVNISGDSLCAVVVSEMDRGIRYAKK